MQFTNLKFSIEETKAMEEKEFFLLKNSAMLKIFDLFGETEKELTELMPSLLDKAFKGEL